jgi:hypothetical protein
MTTTPELDDQAEAEIFSLLKTIRDMDCLDITDDEIRDGHHRIEGYAWLAEHAYRFGMARERERIAIWVEDECAHTFDNDDEICEGCEDTAACIRRGDTTSRLTSGGDISTAAHG